MFNLDNTCRYWLYNKPVDMRKSFNGLSGIVTNAMCERLRSGDMFIFANASRNMMKLLRQEEGGLVLYCIGHGQNECCVKLNTHNYRDTEVIDN